ncbi:MAG: hypothetical protein LBD48_13035 [Treponema sp.]|jgi:maltose alpha-D-glucosyltransferase/alpha-amylase|nr:hypothetical protein [Treponema sp.]
MRTKTTHKNAGGVFPRWLTDAVFYEIYPQSFFDSNGDGTGDFEGIIQKLDYIKSVGCNALWINPCFDSPFRDAGYDVRDYKKTAPRYGTGDDLKRLFSEAHRRGIRVLLDLVPGHTSEEHEWFKESAKAGGGKYRNRYIWTEHWLQSSKGFAFIAGEAERAATYVINFFKCQPALNYGFLRPTENWQLPMNHPDCIATREAMKDVMRFWLDAGCDGFRVDMASSLVKNDDRNKTGVSLIWREVRSMLNTEYPEAAIVAEWSYPRQAINAGFHMDFLLEFFYPPGGISGWYMRTFRGIAGGYRSLFRNYKLDEENRIQGKDESYFKKDSKQDALRFIDEYRFHYRSVKGKGYISLVTGNHDLARMSYNMDQRELSLAYAFIFTLPGIPFLYYGDETGMRYLPLPSKEGGYYRTGSRTPMQWNSGANLGFSDAPAEKLYLPVDAAADAPTVEAQEQSPSSLLNTVRALLRLRHAETDLQAEPNLQFLYAKKGRRPLAYRRGAFVIALNPSAVTETIAALPGKCNGETVFSIGNGSLARGKCVLEAQSFVIWRTGPQ